MKIKSVKKKGAREILYSNVRHRPKSEGQERKLTRYRKCGLEAFRPSEYVENLSLTTLSTLIKLLLYTTYNKFTSQNRLVAHPGECLVFFSCTKLFRDGAKEIVSLLHDVQNTLWESMVSNLKEKEKRENMSPVL